jgi:hypothetical protein
MAIKLAKPKSRDELRAEYIEQHRAALKGLDRVLRDLTEKHRKEYETRTAERILTGVQTLLADRQPNETLRAMYERKFGRKDQFYYSTVARAEALADKYTDYSTAAREGQHEVLDGKRVRLPFEVHMRADADKIAASEAHELVEGIFGTFRDRTADKLVDLMVRRPTYKAVLTHGAFTGGVLEATITLTFPEGEEGIFKRFELRLSLKYNYSVLGNPYVQYPATFHNLVDGNEDATPKATDLDDLYRKFGIEVWKPPVLQKRKWTKVKMGSVVRTVDGRLALVIGSKKGQTKVLFAHGAEDPSEGIRLLDADSVSEIVAQITARSGSDQKDNRAFYELASGTTGVQPFPEIPGRWGEAEAPVRKAMFEKLVKDKTLA